ncbi:MAG TPA: hypothetical protein VF145_13905, partial [Chitinophagaceae bacterium]
HALAVLKAWGAFFRWLVSEKHQYPAKRSALTHLGGVFRHSIIAQYFLAHRKTYSEIVPGGR